jgi:putative ABC transport system permease protein
MRRLVLSEGLWVISIGVTAGLLAAIELSRLLEALLFDVERADPVTLIGMASLVAAAGLLVCWVPARRAASVYPIETLRE